MNVENTRRRHRGELLMTVASLHFRITIVPFSRFISRQTATTSSLVPMIPTLEKQDPTSAGINGVDLFKYVQKP